MGAGNETIFDIGNALEEDTENAYKQASTCKAI